MNVLKQRLLLIFLGVVLCYGAIDVARLLRDQDKALTDITRHFRDEYSQCWRSAVKVIAQHGACKQLGDRDHLKVAVVLLNCHLDSLKKPELLCDPFSSLDSCLEEISQRHLEDSLLMTKGHTLDTCFAMELQEWSTFVTDTLTVLVEASALAGEQLTSITDGMDTVQSRVIDVSRLLNHTSSAVHRIGTGVEWLQTAVSESGSLLETLHDAVSSGFNDIRTIVVYVLLYLLAGFLPFVSAPFRLGLILSVPIEFLLSSKAPHLSDITRFRIRVLLMISTPILHTLQRLRSSENPLDNAVVTAAAEWSEFKRSGGYSRLKATSLPREFYDAYRPPSRPKEIKRNPWVLWGSVTACGVAALWFPFTIYKLMT